MARLRRPAVRMWAGRRDADTALTVERHTAAEAAHPAVPQVLIDRAERFFPAVSKSYWLR